VCRQTLRVAPRITGRQQALPPPVATGGFKSKWKGLQGQGQKGPGLGLQGQGQKGTKWTDAGHYPLMRALAGTSAEAGCGFMLHVSRRHGGGKDSGRVAVCAHD
jgi:hypothetical protein